MDASPFGRYLLLEEMARGGMAVVYRAVLRDDSGFEKHVALKRMLRDLGEDPEFVTRFADEARIVSTLTHANIAQVFDFGQMDGEYFLAMELVDGPDLGSLLGACQRQGQPMPIPTATHVVAEMTRGLGYAHLRRNEGGEPAPVVHRDVSPQNVLVSRSGEVKVVDFGIAKAAEKALKTRTGMVMGKCRHMAPEQALGHAVDARADVFASGTVLFEALTGRPLFPGSTVNQVLAAVLGGPTPPPSSINPEVPPEVDEIVARALKREPEERYPDGSAMARELEALLHRMAPDFSRDDLARFVRTLVPPSPTQGKWRFAATVQRDNDPGGPLAFSETVASGPLQPRSTEAGMGPTLVESEPAPPPPTPPAEEEGAPFALESVAVDLELANGASVSPPRDGSGTLPPGPATDVLEDELAKAPRRWLWLAAAGGLVGLLLGLGGRLLISRPPQASPGQTVRHRGWTLAVRQVERAGNRLMVRLTAVPAPGADLDQARFALLDGDRGLPPLFTSRAPDGGSALVLVFDASATASGLRFMPPRAPPLLLSLEER